MTGDDRREGAPKEAPAKGQGASSMAEFAGVGFQFALSILLFLYVGKWIDGRFGTAPIFLVLGVFLGAGIAFYNMYRRLMAAQRRNEERRRR
jgi:F0F1-type ATP synthase assembly protein I